jgi:hypothetical protein
VGRSETPEQRLRRSTDPAPAMRNVWSMRAPGPPVFTTRRLSSTLSLAGSPWSNIASDNLADRETTASRSPGAMAMHGCGCRSGLSHTRPRISGSRSVRPRRIAPLSLPHAEPASAPSRLTTGDLWHRSRPLPLPARAPDSDDLASLMIRSRDLSRLLTLEHLH